MKIAKRTLSFLLSAGMVFTAAAGCERIAAADAGTDDPKKLSIVTTIFPEYDWVREIMGDNAESADLTMLLDNGVDLHSYQPTTCSYMWAASRTNGWKTRCKTLRTRI